MQAVAADWLDTYYPAEMLRKVVDERYRLVRLLGTGGMGNVYEAVHQGTGRRVAIKVIANSELANDSQAIARFQREAKAAGSVETPHIVQVLDAGTDRATGTPFIAMEFLVGDDVKELSARLGPLDAQLSFRIAAQACAGLQKAHESGIVHRDIKPANLFLAEQADNRLVVKVLDFGIAKLPSKLLSGADALSATTTGRLLGSPLFMSPEQVRGLKTLDHRTDIWSLGAVLYQAVAGRPPFADCETVGQLMVAICSQAAPALDQIAPWVRPDAVALIERALRIDPEERFPTASAMLDALLALLPGGYDIDGDMLLSASGKRMPPRSAREDLEEGTQSLDDSMRFLAERASDAPPTPQSPKKSPRRDGVSDSDSTLPSAHDESVPPNALISDKRTALKARGRRRWLPGFVLLGMGAGVVGAWWVQGRKEASAPAQVEPRPKPPEGHVTTTKDESATREVPPITLPPQKNEVIPAAEATADRRPALTTKDQKRKPAASAATSAPGTPPAQPSGNVMATAQPTALPSGSRAAEPVATTRPSAGEVRPPTSPSAEPPPASPWTLDRDFPVKKGSP